MYLQEYHSTYNPFDIQRVYEKKNGTKYIKILKNYPKNNQIYISIIQNDFSK